MASLRLKSSKIVKPAKPTPIHRLWLSDIDQAKAWTHSPTVYFYRSNGQPNFFSAEVLRRALSQALVQFYPLAGRLEPDSHGRLDLNCNEHGALFMVAESDSTTDDFGHDFTPSPELRTLVPYVDYSTSISEWPLVLVQLTSFSCGGVCLGLGLSHTVFDGAAAMQFVTAWAMIARGKDSSDASLIPYFDRTILRPKHDSSSAPKFDHIEFQPPPFMVGHRDNTEMRKKETTVATLKLSPDQVESLKREANYEGRSEGEREYSRYEAIAGHMWRCACMARGLEPEQDTKVHVSVDCRRRLNPPLPATYFGNATFPATPFAEAGELMSRPLSYAAGRIRERVKGMTDEYVRSAIEFLSNQKDWTPFRTSFHSAGFNHGTFYGCPNLAITSWIGLPMYNADFGWGKPFHMGPTSLGEDGKAYVISAGGDRKEDGSIIVYLRLQTEHMEAFKKLFFGPL